MFGADESIVSGSEPNESEREALKHLADRTRQMSWIMYGGFVLVAITALVDETLFTVAGLALFVAYAGSLGRIVMFRCPRCGGSYRLGKHGFDRHYPHDRCSNGCGLLYKPD